MPAGAGDGRHAGGIGHGRLPGPSPGSGSLTSKREAAVARRDRVLGLLMRRSESSLRLPNRVRSTKRVPHRRSDLDPTFPARFGGSRISMAILNRTVDGDGIASRARTSTDDPDAISGDLSTGLCTVISVISVTGPDVFSYLAESEP